ncbi:MAG: hypothetical protein ABI977_17330 [Acidobacteriota bacterium]
MLKTVTIFLTPKPEDPSQAIVVASPENVRLFIDVDVDDQGNQTVVEVDEVVWRYSKVPPPGSNLPPFPNAPEPIDVNAEVRLPPENTPFGPSPVNGTTPSFLASPSVEMELPAAETESYENIGINPLVPNPPRLDSAPEPTESFGLTAAATAVEGFPSEYEYAVILTSRTSIFALDPKIIIVRRHTRRSL